MDTPECDYCKKSCEWAVQKTTTSAVTKRCSEHLAQIIGEEEVYLVMPYYLWVRKQKEKKGKS